MITHLNQAAVILALGVHVRVTSDLGVCEKRFRKIFCTSIVKGFTPLCPTWAALVDSGLVAALLWISPEV